jgi:transposase
VIHKIKSLYEEGNGCSIRETARQLEISRNTARKYLRLNVEEIQQSQKGERPKRLDSLRDYLSDQLGQYPKLSAVKLGRKLAEKQVVVPVSDRTLRRYIGQLKRELKKESLRRYQPVIDMVPGVQCQVDLGEMRDVLVGGMPTSVYFAVFVLSYSRLLYVSVGDRPVNTQAFIRMHDEAFRYFGGVVEECVYDQTKLVAIREEFREVWLNEAFSRYAAAAGFNVRVCEGYDPESKGKVEAGVKYVKQDGLYGEAFSSWSGVREQVYQWVDQVANRRVHGTTRRVPGEMFAEREQGVLKPYLTPTETPLGEETNELRRVDKTSLISYQGTKYSVPMTYQCGHVQVRAEEGRLVVLDPRSQERVAEHALCPERGMIVKNNNHYRDQSQTIADREAQVVKAAGPELGPQICAVLRATSPHIYKDQLAGFLKVMAPYANRPDLADPLGRLCSRCRLTATFARDFLAAFYSPRSAPSVSVASAAPLAPRAHLAAYGAVCTAAGGGEA